VPNHPSPLPRAQRSSSVDITWSVVVFNERTHVGIDAIGDSIALGGTQRHTI
jgi:hypothetical protein